MLKRILFFLLITGLAAACGNESTGDAQASADNETTTEEASAAGDEMEVQADGKHFGEKINEENAISMTALMTKLENADSLPAKVVGTVEAVCQAKGCWMNVVADNPEQGSVFVKFKDYGFFMPKDIAGRKVIMEGYAFKEVTSVDELKHYAEDEGQPAEEIAKITEPKEERKFMASGVILLEEEGE